MIENSYNEKKFDHDRQIDQRTKNSPAKTGVHASVYHSLIAYFLKTFEGEILEIFC